MGTNQELSDSGRKDKQGDAAGQRVTLVVSAPSGTGKTTICRDLVERDPELVFSVSHTTRQERGSEVNGVDYHFVSKETFQEMVDQGAFLEHAEYRGNCYGTSHAAIDQAMSDGFDVLLEIEVEGARQVREALPEAASIFILPPSLEELERRLRGRQTDAEDVIQSRLDIAGTELRSAPEYRFAVINDELDQAIADVMELVKLIRNGEWERADEGFGCERLLAANPDLVGRVGLSNGSL
ncbi:MAG: guanylate kinase [Deltaproteobacteria bacterium]|nr:guanylate kinase [Deltaproteobacteria bacterium]